MQSRIAERDLRDLFHRLQRAGQLTIRAALVAEGIVR